jgi:hypothetical protein
MLLLSVESLGLGYHALNIPIIELASSELI